MNNDTQYQSVPTTTITTGTKSHFRPKSSSLFIIGLICVGVGIPLINFGALRYERISNFSGESSYCRVNAIGTERINGRSSCSVRPIWNVDIVKQSDYRNGTKGIVVIRPNLKIYGFSGYVYPTPALEEPSQLYSVGKTYPCYVGKELLKNVDDNNEKINYKKRPIQWEKPSLLGPLTALCVGSVCTFVGIITLFSAFLFHYRNDK